MSGLALWFLWFCGTQVLTTTAPLCPSNLQVDPKNSPVPPPKILHHTPCMPACFAICHTRRQHRSASPPITAWYLDDSCQGVCLYDYPGRTDWWYLTPRTRRAQMSINARRTTTFLSAPPRLWEVTICRGSRHAEQLQLSCVTCTHWPRSPGQAGFFALRHA